MSAIIPPGRPPRGGAGPLGDPWFLLWERGVRAVASRSSLAARSCPIVFEQRCAQPRSIQNVSVNSGGSLSMPSFSNAGPSLL